MHLVDVTSPQSAPFFSPTLESQGWKWINQRTVPKAAEAIKTPASSLVPWNYPTPTPELQTVSLRLPKKQDQQRWVSIVNIIVYI